MIGVRHEPVNRSVGLGDWALHLGDGVGPMSADNEVGCAVRSCAAVSEMDSIRKRHGDGLIRRRVGSAASIVDFGPARKHIGRHRALPRLRPVGN